MEVIFYFIGYALAYVSIKMAVIEATDKFNKWDKLITAIISTFSFLIILPAIITFMIYLKKHERKVL